MSKKGLTHLPITMCEGHRLPVPGPGMALHRSWPELLGGCRHTKLQDPGC